MASALHELNLFSSSSDNDLVLDSKIRDWVLLPILLVMFFQGILRQYLGIIFADEKKAPVLADLSKTMLLRRANRFRANAQFIPPNAAKMRRAFFLTQAFPPKKDDSKEKEKKDKDAPQMPDLGAAMPPSDPTTMITMMKRQMGGLIPSVLLMGWVSYFFSGFILAKLPFGMPDRFKPMLSRGVMLKALDASYVSSISWYILLYFGLRGVFSLVLGDEFNALADSQMQPQMMMMGGDPMQAPNFPELFNNERNEIEILESDWQVPEAEQRLLQAKHTASKSSSRPNSLHND
eukprot:TRINITY_DN1239_c0_g2_i1.p1 TRINITY_DN1239_c0_g2~~TRINITY_DN1239_c0_g2_i1.p1  ORF type:complete len:291 (-),score=65.70 TRINITY_DN1239_c0_g2_i1:217-1089(-)